MTDTGALGEGADDTEDLFISLGWLRARRACLYDLRKKALARHLGRKVRSEDGLRMSEWLTLRNEYKDLVTTTADIVWVGLWLDAERWGWMMAHLLEPIVQADDPDRPVWLDAMAFLRAHGTWRGDIERVEARVKRVYRDRVRAETVPTGDGRRGGCRWSARWQ